MNEKKKWREIPKRILAFVLTLAMVLTLMPGMSMTVKAEITGGDCGATGNESNVKWSFDSETGTLTISGSGEMADYYFGTEAPWDTKKLNINNIVIGQNVTTVGNLAFYGCTNVTSIEIPNTVTSIGFFAFKGCTNVTSIMLSDNLTSIGFSAFQDCSQLTSLKLPVGVTSFGGTTFAGCSKLASIEILGDVTSIGVSEFNGCSSLTSITIPNKVTAIAEYTFNGCSKLESITLPAGVTSIGESAFSGCTNLKKIIVNATTPPSLFFNDWFEDSPGPLDSLPTGFEILVPATAVEAYKAASGWNKYADHIKAQHSHSFNYSASRAKLTAKSACHAQDGCEFDNTEKTVELTLTASDANYSGSAVEPTITYGKDPDEKTAWTNAGLVLPESDVTGAPTIIKTYYNTDASGNKTGTALSEAPSAVGKYIVDVKVSYGTDKEATVSLPYELIKPEYLTFTAEETNAAMSFDWNTGGNVQIKASSTNVTVGDGNATGDWQDYTAGTTITLPAVGDAVSFKGENVTTNSGKKFNMENGKIAASGDVTSLTNGTGGDAALADHCYDSMFFRCTGLTSAPALPATTLTANCYAYMFYGCTGITSAPALSATTLAASCYTYMFYGCTGITSAPALPATNLEIYCYRYMFQGCTGLTSVPELPATTLTDYCYESMFQDCTGITSAPELPATTLAVNCCKNMFRGCTGITRAPELSATNLENACYHSMFYGCTGLTSAPELSATTIADSCYNSMFSGCTGLTSAPELPATTLATSCYYGMFQGCTGLTKAPELPATTLVASCYTSMFQGCTGLTSAPALPATTLAEACYKTMFLGCTGLKRTPELPATTLAKNCYQSMFNGCTGLTSVPDLPATTLLNLCYGSMFNGCTGIEVRGESNKGTEYVVEWKIPATTGTANWYNSMFTNCSNVDLNGAGGTTVALNTTYYLKHVHNWKYVADGATLKAYCAETRGAGTCAYQGSDTDLERAVSLTLTASDANYSGSTISKDAIFGEMDFTEFNTATGLNLSVSDIKIYAADDTLKATPLDAINTAGSYVADLTVSGKTATCNVTVNEGVSTVNIASYPKKNRVINSVKVIVNDDGTTASAADIIINAEDTGKYEVLELIYDSRYSLAAAHCRPKSGYYFKNPYTNNVDNSNRYWTNTSGTKDYVITDPTLANYTPFTDV